jgi:uncharacterized RDD family membrane protein YckC
VNAADRHLFTNRRRTLMETTTTAAPPRLPSYAGFWKRFAAYLIDTCLLALVSLVLVVFPVLLLGIGSASEELDDPSMGLIAVLLGMYLLVAAGLFLLQWLYFALMESTRGATFGKMALGIRVTDMHGRLPSFGRASGRYFAKIISSLTFGIGYIIAGFSQQKQALHDIIAGCLVVNNE